MKSKIVRMRLARAVAPLVIWMASALATAAVAVPAHADPNIWDYVVPSTLTKLVATGRTVAADQTQLEVIGKDYGDAYRLKEGKYTFTAPDRLEYTTQLGPTTVTLISTNTQIQVVTHGLVHLSHTTDISGDITKRKTLFDLGILPKNYLETMRVEYDGEDTAIGVPCQVFTLRYLTDAPDSHRRFKLWIDPVKHYVVQKTVWNMQNAQHETVFYRDPVIVPGTHIYMPTEAEVWNQNGKFGGKVQYTKLSGEETS